MKKANYLDTYYGNTLITIRMLLLNFLLLLSGISYSQQSYTFTPCGATGAAGPTQLQANAGYFTTNLNGSVTIIGQGIQQFTVPTSGMWQIEARGAMGYNPGGAGGRGAIMRGDFNLTAGTVLNIAVGQEGQVNPAAGTLQYGGGGGSFVTLVNNIPLCIAGGGGGSHVSSYATSTADGTVITTGNTGAGSTSGAGGTGGSGGAASSSANGGAGLLGDGGGTTGPALSFTNGALGGNLSAIAYANGGIGGFGGGGGTQSWNNNRGGGGGGYSGGGGGQLGQPNCWGGGGGSFNAGANQLNISGANTFSDGLVIITALCNINLINSSTTGPGPICAGNAATITTNAISNYAWSNGSTNASIVVTPSVTTSYTLTATSPSNCTASSVITITVQSGNPIVTALTSSTAVCAGQPVVLSGAGANTYTWTGGVTNAVSFSPTATGGYSVIGANACGTGTAAVNVTVNSSPVVLGGVTSPTVCNGTAVTFTSGGNATTYSWSNGVINNSPYIPGATNNYTLTGTANGCSSITVVGVTVFITPTITPIATPSAICIGQTATLSSTGAAGYTWTPGISLTTSLITVSPPAPTTYTLVRTNGVCSSTTNLLLVVNPLPLLSASGSPSQICMGTGVNLNVTGAITYTWLPGNFNTANFTLYPNFSTTYTVTGSSGSCTASQTVPVIVNPTPTLTINTPTSTICQGQSVTLTAGGALSYTWQTAGGGNNAAQPVSPSTTTIYVVSGTNSYGCTSSQNQLILVNPAPTIVINSSAPYACSGSTVVLSVNNSSSNITYLWNSGPIGPSISVSPVITSNYTVTGTDNNTGCTSTGTTALAVYISTFAVTAPTAICIGSVATFSAAGAAATYSWSVNGGTAAPSVTVSPVLSSNYYVTGTTGSCTTTQTVPLLVNPLPNVTANVAKSQICRFEVATITGNGASTYSWNTGANSQVLTFTLSVTTTYTLTGIDTKGCSKTTTVTQFVATCIGIENNSPDNLGLNIYPNPNNGNFVISSDVSVTLHLVNALGQEITTFNLNEGDKQVVTVSSLPSGIYFINGQSTGVKINKKVIIER